MSDKSDSKLRLRAAADFGHERLADTGNVSVPPQLANPKLQLPDGTSCKQNIRISIFFDGTGNNLQADTPDGGESNVAKLYRAHPENSIALNCYKIYVPGIGTYFDKINDPGGGGLDGGKFGMGLGGRGQSRLDWALGSLKEQIMECDKNGDRFPNATVQDIKLAVFGFSRGAAAARAFCRDLAKLCPRGQYALPVTKLQVPIEVDFLGLFDTVASVGLPASANTIIDSAASMARSLDSPGYLGPTREELLKQIAFGEPGASPALGSNEGHYAWGNDIAIYPLIKKCLHLVAAHEWRNSFPLDSTLVGNKYPASVTEMAMPGSHSDVGGGYEPCEGGKSRRPGTLMSLIPLWIMFEEAGKVVPFYKIDKFADYNREDFGIDARSEPGFKSMSTSYSHYLEQIKEEGGLGKIMLEHKRLYFAWRFRAIRRGPTQAQRNLAAKHAAATTSSAHVQLFEDAKALHKKKGFPWPEDAEGGLDDARRQSLSDEMALSRARDDVARAEEEDGDVAKGETEFAPARKQLTDDARNKHSISVEAAVKAEQWNSEKRRSGEMGVRWSSEQDNLLRQVQKEALGTKDDYLKAQARLDTKANDSELVAHIRKYDEELMEDALSLDAWLTQEPSLRLRPHYKIMLDAYRNEFQRSAGLLDAAIIDFFDHYVHDSLAGFDRDDTRTSDPRIIYVGGNMRALYASTDTTTDTRAVSA